MKLKNILKLIEKKGVSEQEVQGIEDKLNCKLPDWYKDILMKSNGLSINGGKIIYGIDDVVERNSTMQIRKYEPNYIAIGDDGGGMVYLMKCNANEKKIVIVDGGYIDVSEPDEIINDISKWIKGGLKSKDELEWEKSKYSNELSNIVLVRMPKGGAKELLAIKKKLKLNISTGELLRGSKKLPFILKKNIPYEIAKIQIRYIQDYELIFKILLSND